MANKNFYRTKNGILINLNHIISIHPQTAANQYTKVGQANWKEWSGTMLKSGFTPEEIENIKNTAPYGKMVVTHTDSDSSFTTTTVEPIGYYAIKTLGVKDGNSCTIIITYEDYENILEIIDF